MISTGDVIVIAKDDGTIYTIEIVTVMIDIEYGFSPMVYYCHSTNPNEVGYTTIENIVSWFKGDAGKEFSYMIVYNNEFTRPKPVVPTQEKKNATKKRNKC